MLSRARNMLVDVHTHVYLPRYANLMRARSKAPRIVPSKDGKGESLIVLEGKDSGRTYWDRSEKLAFMDKHDIDISVVSTANPWLDFLTAKEAPLLATQLNEDLETYCATGPSLSSSLRRFYGFGLLPLLPDVPTSEITSVIEQIGTLPHLKGVIMGTKGIGKGLDDPELEPIWEAIASKGLVIFLHPHYGIPDELFGDIENGHVLPLALGFPFETAIATARFILAGVLDRHPNLRLLLAHSGGALPMLSSRLASCIAHDPLVARRLKHDARHYLGMLYYDAVAYGAPELTMAKWSALGSQRMMFGTDHPFFPPVPGVADTDAKWASVTENLAAIKAVPGWSEADKEGVRSGNAIKIFGLA
ncbi:putative 2-amino-3-carboxymuconate-6-semialdehyde decarboxylase [Rhizoctonia solani 123E]|uniref:Putative 2-amino-3-carboxymuconate-6-semialdehyde decarboxylase n=1 Tax=Rhizoctonia solani 123E TaxID=1423351 RepID=A0A074S9T9_9AGAM|nr:putative 2-amino-3-carboxymuconate-6-semialdehyde decarboxylase [Rhizoctonia solani 123E]